MLCIKLVFDGMLLDIKFEGGDFVFCQVVLVVVKFVKILKLLS